MAVITFLVNFSILGHQRSILLADSFFAAVFSVSNFYFWVNTSYFSPVAENNPFLHYWSLSVEEQFYLLWPSVLLMLLWTFKGRISAALILISVGFFAISYALFVYDPTAMFYLLPARVFQFSAGAFIAYAQMRGIGSLLAEDRFALPALGIGVVGFIACSVYTSGDNYSFWISAALPTLFSVLMIIATFGQRSAQFFEFTAMVWTGKRAYSLYLVHWPIMVYFQQVTGPNRPLVLDVAIVAACFAFGELLFRYVETPFRIARFDSVGSQQRKLGLTLGSVGAVSVLFVVWKLLLPLAQPASTAAQTSTEEVEHADRHASATNTDRFANASGGVGFIPGDYVAAAEVIGRERVAANRPEEKCHVGWASQQPIVYFNAEFCLRRTPGVKTVLLIGDSYGPEMVPFLEAILPSSQILRATMGGCRPVYLEPNETIGRPGCDEFNRYRYSSLDQRDDITAVVLSANWQQWSPTHFRNTINYLAATGRMVFVIGPRPTFSVSIPELLSSPNGANVYNDLRRYQTFDMAEKTNMMTDVIDSHPNVHFISIQQYFCNPNCPAFFNDNHLIYIDAAHIGPNFVKAMAARVLVDQPEPVARLRAAIAP